MCDLKAQKRDEKLKRSGLKGYFDPASQPFWNGFVLLICVAMVIELILFLWFLAHPDSGTFQLEIAV